MTAPNAPSGRQPDRRRGFALRAATGTRAHRPGTSLIMSLGNGRGSSESNSRAARSFSPDHWRPLMRRTKASCSESRSVAASNAAMARSAAAAIVAASPRKDAKYAVRTCSSPSSLSCSSMGSTSGEGPSPSSRASQISASSGSPDSACPHAIRSSRTALCRAPLQAAGHTSRAPDPRVGRKQRRLVSAQEVPRVLHPPGAQQVVHRRVDVAVRAVPVGRPGMPRDEVSLPLGSTPQQGGEDRMATPPGSFRDVGDEAVVPARAPSNAALSGR